MSTTAPATTVSQVPNVASARPDAPVASRYELVPLQAATTPSPSNGAVRATPRVPARAHRRRRSKSIVPSLERAERRRVGVVTKVALTAFVGEPGRVGAALRLDVGGDLPDERRRQRPTPRRHALRPALEDRLVDVRRRAAVAPVAVRQVRAHAALQVVA